MFASYLFGILQLPIYLFLIGFGPLLFFNGVIKARSAYSYIFFSIILGVVINPIVHLTVGHFGLPITGINYKYIQLGLLLLSFGLAYYKLRGRGIMKKLGDKDILRKHFRLTKVDILFVVVFTIYFGFMIVVNSKIYVPVWDQFNFWLTDAKIIHTTGFLRKDDSIINEVLYGSFMPIHYIPVYEIFGSLVEQYAAFVSILFGILATYISYIWCRKFSQITQVISIFALLAVNLALSTLLLSTYADLAMIFYGTLVVFLMVRRVKIENYSQKLFLIALVLFGFSILKVFNTVYTIVLVGTYILYDLEIMKKFFNKKYLLSKVNLLYLSIIVFALFAQIFYRERVLDFELHIPFKNIGPVESLGVVFEENHPIRKLLYNFKVIWKHFSRSFRMRTFLFLFVWVFALSRIVLELYRTRSTKTLKNYSTHIFLLTLVIVLPWINLIHYTIVGRSGQLDRYVLPMIFVIPMVISIFTDEIKTYRFKFYILLIIIVALFLFFPTRRFTTYFNSMTIPTTTGSYEDAPLFTDYKRIKYELREHLGDETIFIAKYNEHCQVTREQCVINNRFDMLVMNYFMIENRAEGTIMLDLVFLNAYLEEHDIEYMLLFDSEEYAMRLDDDVKEGDFYHLFRYHKEDETYEFVEAYEKTVSDKDQF